MSIDTQNSSGGTTQDAASGGQEIKKTEVTENKTQDTVSYETYSKVLSEKKKRDAELAEYKAKEKERLENDLKAKEDFKTMLSMREKELAEAREESKRLKEGLMASVKLDSLLNKLSGKVSQEYYGLFDLDKIVIDPTTNQIDEMSLVQYAKEVELKYSDVIKKPTSVTLPNAAPNANGAVNFENWHSMPLADKKKYEKEYIQYIKTKM